MNTVTDVAAHIKQIWSSSAFMNLLKIEIDEIHCGGATVKMPIDFDIHTNHWLGVHGGALAALADAVMGITGASVGDKIHMAITPTVPPKEKNRKSNNNRCIFQFSFSKITSSVDVVCCSIIL